VGHITQLCVTPEARGRGLGEALLRAAVGRLADAGAERVGLTVTLSNRAALKLYQHCGFSELKRFFAYAKDV
jgi:ribosomal protein S18 acetylase RimI-like enzyme